MGVWICLLGLWICILNVGCLDLPFLNWVSGLLSWVSGLMLEDQAGEEIGGKGWVPVVCLRVSRLIHTH